jgi:opacity protein-like surface antigen
MKKMLFLLALVVALVPFVAVSAAAQAPVAHLGEYVLAPGTPPIMSVPFAPRPAGHPSYCNPCLFYTGDTNQSTCDGVDNELGGSLGNGEYAEVYDGMTVPKGKKWTITKLFINTAPSSSTSVDPTLPWDIRFLRNGQFEEFAYGTDKDTFQANGQSCSGYNVYTNMVTLKKKAVLKAGTYFVDVLTSCQTSSCSGGGEFFEVDQESAPTRTKCTGTNCYGPPQPWDDSYFNSNYFGISWELTTEVCGSGYCDQFSFGAVGTASADN